MTVTTKTVDSELVLHVCGRVDTYTAEEFEKALMTAIRSADTVRIDFEEIEFVSSAGLRALLNGQKLVNEEDKELICCNVNEVVEEVFASTGFDNVLEIE